jgi:hypothetical protein
MEHVAMHGMCNIQKAFSDACKPSKMSCTGAGLLWGVIGSWSCAYKDTLLLGYDRKTNKHLRTTSDTRTVP